MDTLSFSYNWNNKLNCNCFSTIRLHDPVKYSIGRRFKVTCKHIETFEAEIVCISNFKLNTISDGVSYIDTGYSRERCIEIIKTMYRNSKIDLSTAAFSMIILKKI